MSGWSAQSGRLRGRAAGLLASTAVLATLAVSLTGRALGEERGSSAVAQGSAEAPVMVRLASRDPALAAALAESYDVWTFDRRAGFILLRLGGEGTPGVAAALAELTTLGHQVTIDWPRTAELRMVPTATAEQLAGAGGIAGFPCYRTVEETHTSMASLAVAHPTLAQIVDLGDSFTKVDTVGAAGYDLLAVVLTDQKRPGPKFPLVLIGAMHAREYATAELATRFAETLVNGYGVDPDATWLLDHGAIHVIPQLNPDGRKQAEAGLFWRKNVAPTCGNPTSTNRGVDLNRNSSVFWGGSGSSSSCSSETFRGPSAASEPETQAIHAYLAGVFADQRGPNPTDSAPPETTGLFISLHSYGGYVLFPWEGITSQAPNDSGLATLARKLGYFNGYLACQDGLPPAAGTTVDQAYGLYGVAAYTFELGNAFFESCAAFEATVAPVNLDALVYAAKASRRPYQEPAGPETLELVATPPSLIAGEPLTLSATAADDRSDSNGCGNEPIQAIASAGWSLDEPPWAPIVAGTLDATDGVFDSAVEAVGATVDTTSFPGGRRLIYAWAVDAAGNRGVPSAVWVEVTSPVLFADGFESGNLAGWEP